MAAKQTDVQEARNALRDAAEALDDAVEAFTAMGTLAWRDDTRELQAKVHELVAQFAVCFKDEPEQAPDDLTTRLRTIEAEDGEVEATIAVARRVMADAAHPAVQLSVPLQVDAKAAANWDEAH